MTFIADQMYFVCELKEKIGQANDPFQMGWARYEVRRYVKLALECNDISMITKEEVIHILDVATEILAEKFTNSNFDKFVYPQLYENFLDIIMGFEDEDILEESTE